MTIRSALRGVAAVVLAPTAFLALCGALLAPAFPQDPRAPTPEMTFQAEGLNVVVLTPTDIAEDKERSMVVVLHGAGGTETGMAHSLAHLTKLDYVVVAPKSKGPTWSEEDLAAVRKIVRDLREKHHVGEKRLHAVGFSNGGWNRARISPRGAAPDRAGRAFSGGSSSQGLPNPMLRPSPRSPLRQIAIGTVCRVPEPISIGGNG